LNILFLTTHLNAGGITSYLFTLTKGLISSGHHVYLVSSGGNQEKDFLSLGAKSLRLNIKIKSELDLRLYLPVHFLKKYMKECHIDVIHAQTRVTQVMGNILRKCTGVPYVATCHGFFKPRFFRKIFPCWGDRTIAISSAVKEHLEKDFGILPSYIDLVESGIDLQKFQSIDSTKREERRLSLGIKNECVVGIIARLSDVKGQDILIQAFQLILKEHPYTKLLLVGEGKLMLDLKQIVKDLNIEKDVIFTPVVKEIKDYLDCIDIFVMPSRNEGLGLSIMEAQACGLPVVASRVGGIPALIEEGKTGFLVEPEDVQGLAGAIIDLIRNPQKAKNVGLCASRFAKTHYAAEKMTEKTVEVYQKVLRND